MLFYILLLQAFLATFLIEFWPTGPGMALFMGFDLLNKLNENVPQTLPQAHKPAWWRLFFIWGCVFLDYSKLVSFLHLKLITLLHLLAICHKNT